VGDFVSRTGASKKIGPAGSGGAAVRDGSALDERPAARGTASGTYWDEFRRKLRSGEIGSVPVAFGLIVIWIIFQSLDHQFLSPRNLSNLSVDIVGTGLLAVGIVFVLLLGEMDLSVGSVSGLTAAVFAVLNVNNGLPEWLAIIAALLSGAAVGAVQGFFFAKIGVPAFIVTLAGLLGWNGLMLYVLGSSGTINLNDQGVVTTLTGYYFHNVAAAYGLAALSTAVFVLSTYQDARRRKAAAVPSRPFGENAIRTAVVAVIAFAAAYVLNQFQGLPLALLIFLAFVVGLDFVLRRTTYGRNIFSIGGGVEATRRAGVRVDWVRISVFAVSGTLAAVGGLFLASRVASVGQTSGSSNLLINAIAAAVIGGASLFGGRGSPWSALLGVLVIQSIGSGMVLMNIQTAVQYMITGGVLLAAVTLDSVSRRSQKAHGRY
jgi:D-xylose transport system permease protein